MTPATGAWWALARACAAAQEEFQGTLASGEKPVECFKRQLTLVREQSPGLAAADVVEGYHLSQEKEYARALPLLEKLGQCPDMAHYAAVYQLWLTRVHVLGPDRGLSCGFVETPAGGWAYGAGVRLDGELKDEFPEAPNWPEAKLEELVARYYERGLIWFEGFFATGKGKFRDGDVHEYSMLCNNLAIKYNYSSEQWDKAIAVHEKGIAASPCAEHY